VLVIMTSTVPLMKKNESYWLLVTYINERRRRAGRRRSCRCTFHGCLSALEQVHRLICCRLLRLRIFEAMVLAGGRRQRRATETSRVQRLALSKLRDGLSWPQWSRLRHANYDPVLRGRILAAVRMHCPVEVRRLRILRNGAFVNDVRGAYRHMMAYLSARGWLRAPDRGETAWLIVSADKRRIWGPNETIGIRLASVVDNQAARHVYPLMMAKLQGPEVYGLLEYAERELQLNDFIREADGARLVFPGDQRLVVQRVAISADWLSLIAIENCCAGPSYRRQGFPICPFCPFATDHKIGAWHDDPWAFWPKCGGAPGGGAPLNPPVQHGGPRLWDEVDRSFVFYCPMHGLARLLSLSHVGLLNFVGRYVTSAAEHFKWFTAPAMPSWAPDKSFDANRAKLFLSLRCYDRLVRWLEEQELHIVLRWRAGSSPEWSTVGAVAGRLYRALDFFRRFMYTRNPTNEQRCQLWEARDDIIAVWHALLLEMPPAPHYMLNHAITDVVLLGGSLFPMLNEGFEAAHRRDIALRNPSPRGRLSPQDPYNTWQLIIRNIYTTQSLQMAPAAADML
jgi:hypothetical protein